MFADAVEAVLLFLEGFLSHYSEMIYLNLAADLFLHSMFWELFLFLDEYGKCKHWWWLWGARPADCLR